VSATAQRSAALANPYVGPRAFRYGETMYARKRETRELGNLLVAERIVLLHAPSGAGKTSLIRAGLLPQLERRRFRPTKPLRVNTKPPDRPVHNRYVHSVALGLLDGKLPQKDYAELAELDFAAVIDRVQPPEADGFLVLVFDQFEEILTMDPTDWENQAVFFKEVGRTLAERPVWALFSMREDYMGGLYRFARYVPGHLATRYRLDFLDRAAAKNAIQLPAQAKDIRITDEAAEELVRRLAVVRIQSPGGAVETVEAPYVQPVQLQVVCHRLWESAWREKQQGAGFHTIELADVVAHADIPRALRGYYAGAVAKVAKKTKTTEAAIRNWFETELITAEGFRSQTVTGPKSGDIDPKTVLEALERVYLIRGDQRGDTTWWELTHDMLVDPILDDNGEQLEPWQVAARRWGRDGGRERLLHGAELRDAQKRAHQLELTKVEEDFLEHSVVAEKERGRRAWLSGIASLIGVIAFVELIVILLLVSLMLSR
jgi:hypothetical protein